jgi:hypothetical protein
MTIGKEFLERLKNVKVNQRRADRTVKSLIDDFQKEKIIIPEYQRNFVWPLDVRCRFIESIFMNVPIPSVFLLEKSIDGKKNYEVLDGVQRLSTLESFYKGVLRLKELEKLNDLNQVTFSMLSEDTKTFFLDQKISTVFIEEDTSPDLRFEVFERLNQGSVSLTAQELRNCMFHGQFNDFLKRLSQRTGYKELLSSSFGKFRPIDSGKPDKNRMMDVEMVLRFLALYEGQKESKNETYSPPRKDFLNLYMEQKQKQTDQTQFALETKVLENLFEEVVSMIKSVFHGNQFKRFAIDKGNTVFLASFNKAVFDVQMQGFVDCKDSDIMNNADIIYDAFLDISVRDPKFIAAIKSSTDQQVDVRIKIWKAKLRHVIENCSRYKNDYDAKYMIFDKNPNCAACNNTISTFADAYLEQGRLIHRACIINKTSNESRTKIIKFIGIKDDENYEFDDVDDALSFLLPVLKTAIEDDPSEVERLISLDFIGTSENFRAATTSGTKVKLKSLKINYNEETLFMDYSGSSREVVSRIHDIASLYGFFDVVLE